MVVQHLEQQSAGAGSGNPGTDVASGFAEGSIDLFTPGINTVCPKYLHPFASNSQSARTW